MEAIDLNNYIKVEVVIEDGTAEFETIDNELQSDDSFVLNLNAVKSEDERYDISEHATGGDEINASKTGLVNDCEELPRKDVLKLNGRPHLYPQEPFDAENVFKTENAHFLANDTQDSSSRYTNIMINLDFSYRC